MLSRLIGRQVAQCSRPLGLLNAQRALMTYMPSPGDYTTKTVTLLPGDGVGPEVTAAAVRVLGAAGAPVTWERFDNCTGFTAGAITAGVPDDVLASIRTNKVCLKGPIFTPIDGSTIESINVQLRKSLNLQVNLVHAFNIPGLNTRYTDLDIVVIRENTEGEYSGVEHEVVPGVVEALKVITEKKSRATAEYAFEYASLNGRKKVTAVHKANIMKIGDGQFLSATREVAERFPHILYEEMIVDNTCMQLVSKPEQFDVMVTPNLYGNIVSNVAAGLCGGHGVCPGGNVGRDVAVFEAGARHVGSEAAGKNSANPTAILLSSVMMLRHLKLPAFAAQVERAVMAVHAAGDRSVLTQDVGGTGTTIDFTEAVVAALGKAGVTSSDSDDEG